MESGLCRIALVALAWALSATGAQAQAPAETKGIRFLASPGIGFGTGGVHAFDKGDSKPGEYLIVRAGVARNGRPFVIADGEFQLYHAPYQGQKADFTAFSVLAGIALSPVADFYLMPQAGVQFRSWRGEEAPAESGSGFTAGLIAGYHLGFGPRFSMQPEFVLRYADVTGPGSPSFRGVGFRLMAAWVF